MRSGRLILGLVIVAGGALAGLYVTGRPPFAPKTAPAAPPNPMANGMPVPVAKVEKRSLSLYLEYPARMESIRNISLQARVNGYLEQQVARDGADVKENDVLYKIDTRDLQVAVDQARAQLQRDQAGLDYARANYNRGSELVKSGFVAKDVYDQRASTLGQSQASIEADKAAVRQAELNLGYAEIRAPFAGRLGRNQAPIGTLISVAGGALNTLVQLDPIYVTFAPSDSDLATIEKARRAGKVTAEVFVSGSNEPRQRGDLTFIDNVIDKATGTITARATVANPDFTLLPGQFVRIRLKVGEQPDALLLPQTAIGSNQLGKFVYVVGEGNKADQRMVTLGQTDGAFVSVTKGVSENDQVIVGNVQKIGPGVPVQPLPPKPQGS